MLRIFTTLLTVFTSSIALVIAIHSVVVDVQEASALWVAQKVVFSTAVMLLGALTLWTLWSRAVSRASWRRILWVGAIGLVPLGGLTVVKTVHLARVTGDWEMYAIAAGVALIGQGLLTLWNLWDQQPKEA